MRGQRKRFVSLPMAFFIILLVAGLSVAVIAHEEIYQQLLERIPPQIEVLEFPRGVGKVPVQARFRIRDDHSGLDEVIIRVWQKRRSFERFRKKLKGAPGEEITIDFPGGEEELKEGTAVVEIKAFDRSFWSNGSEKQLPLQIDYERPLVEAITTQHNAQEGGAQLIFYRAVDDHLMLSGVRVGSSVFSGFPARSLDPDFQDKSLFVALYAIPEGKGITSKDLRLFAEDRVGNVQSISFYNKISKRRGRKIDRKLSESFLRKTVRDLARRYGGEQRDSSSGENVLVRDFRLVNESLRRVNEAQLQKALKGGSYGRQWEGPFFRPAGRVIAGFSDQIHFSHNSQELGQWVVPGYLMTPDPRSSSVTTANHGVVRFIGTLGIYGLTVVIDHGIGLSSFYTHLDSIQIKENESLESGFRIGSAGKTGFADRTQLLFGMAVHGVFVNPKEWLDQRWVQEHIFGKAEDVKKSLGIPIFREIR